MTGGFVKWDGEETNKVHSPPGSKNGYSFKKGVFTHVKDEKDYKWYDWKSTRNDPEHVIWSSKRRLAKEDTSFERQFDARPKVDENDPYFGDNQLRKQVYEDYKLARERVRKYFGKNLPDALKEAKNLYEGGEN